MFRISFFLFFLFSTGATAQKNLQVLDWKSDLTLNDHLVQQVHLQYEQRRQNFEKAITGNTAAVNYIREVQRKAKELLGSTPVKTPLLPMVTGTVYRKHYRIEKLHYQSFPGHYVTANLYIPEGKGRFPAVLFLCGHEDQSKATDSYQRTAALFAQNGFIVLVIDPISQSERHQLTDSAGKPLTRGGTTEHTLLNAGSNLLGTSTAADELRDNIRGLDYLISRDDVDPKRIGCLGNSGGAMQTIYMAAVETRLKVFAVCSYLAQRNRTFELSGPADGCAQIPGEGAAGMELSDYLIAAAPKPVLVLAGRYDFIDYTGTTAAYRQLEKIYNVIGQPKKIKMVTIDDGHGISKPKREAAVQWFRSWMMQDRSPVKETASYVLAEKELLVTPKASVERSFPDAVSIARRNRLLADSFSGRRKYFTGASLRYQQALLRRALQLPPVKDSILFREELSPMILRGVTMERIILRKNGELPLPLLFFRPKGVPRGWVIGLHERGKIFLADSARYLESKLEAGFGVVLPDLRGTGETTDRISLNDPKYYNREYRNAMTALHLGRNLAGQRVTDLETVLQFIEKLDDRGTGPINLEAWGAPVTPALHAALLFPEITFTKLSGGLRSFLDLLADPVQKDQYSYVIPGVLQRYDLPDLYMVLGSSRVQWD